MTTMEARLFELEREIAVLKSQKNNKTRHKWLKDRHTALKRELNEQNWRYAHGVHVGINALLRGALNCRDLASLSDEGVELANRMFDELKPIIEKYHRSKNDRPLCLAGRLYETNED